jgi:hypothetical protein
VTTDTLNTLLPGIKDVYGTGVPVDIHFKLEAVTNTTVTATDEVLGGLMTLNLGFYPVGGSPALAADLTL